jgi:hypothetical protein
VAERGAALVFSQFLDPHKENTVIRKSTTAMLLAIFLVSSIGSTGCIGRMATSGTVMKFNLKVVESKWAREGVFLLLYIIPVYPLAGMVDLLIINSIEFHTGTNPLSGQERLARVGETRDVAAPDGTKVVSTLRSDGSIDLAITTVDGQTHHANVLKDGETIVARDADGNTVGTMRDGQVELASTN